MQSTPSLAQSAPPKLSSRSRLRLNLKDSPTQGHHSVVRAIDFEAENDTPLMVFASEQLDWKAHVSVPTTFALSYIALR